MGWLNFFANALDSKTSGIDYVFNQRNIKLGDVKFGFNLSGNYTIENERDGAVKNPAGIANAGKSVLDPTQEALIFTSRPKFKTILGIDADFGQIQCDFEQHRIWSKTKFHNADLSDTQNLEVVFKTKTLTDLAINYQLDKNLTLAFNVNNMFNVTPSWKLQAVNDVAKAKRLLTIQLS